MSEDVWTLARVADERPALAPLARLHSALEEASAAAVEELPDDALRPQFAGPPAVQWFQGKPLLEARGVERIAPGIGAFSDSAEKLTTRWKGSRPAS